MTQSELYTHLKSLGLPIAYHHFTEETQTPYIIYLFSYSSDFIADNMNFKDVSNFIVELYTEKKDLESEELIQNKLKELKIPYQKIEAWIESERLYQVGYTIQLI